MKPVMLALRTTPQGEEYFELNREFPSSLSAPKNHQHCMRLLCWFGSHCVLHVCVS